MGMRMRRLRCFMVLFMQTVSWVCSTSRPFAANCDASSLPSGTGLMGLHATEYSSLDSNFKPKEPKEEEEKRGKRGMGSSPPNCEKKCYGCEPCEAIQVLPTSPHFALLYSNYEPQGWRCKCGPSFFSP